MNEKEGKIYTLEKRIARIFISIFISLVGFVIALLLSADVAERNMGRNYSDVGINMYSNSVEAFRLGMTTYSITIVLIFIWVWLIWKSKYFACIT